VLGKITLTNGGLADYSLYLVDNGAPFLQKNHLASKCPDVQ